MILFRRVVGVVLAIVGSVLFVGSAFSSSVALAILVLGGTIVGHLVTEGLWDQWNQNGPPAANEAPSAETVSALRGFPSTFLTTAGVVLALLTAFASKPPGLGIKVAGISLAMSIILSIVLAGLLVGSIPATRKTGELMSLLFNLAWWSLAFGLLNIAFSLAYLT